MDFSSINWLAVVVCTVISMVIGFAWYNPKTFFPGWWAAMGKGEFNPDAQMDGSMGMTWGLTILSAFVRALFIGLFVKALGATTLVAGAMTGFWLFLGLVATTTLTNKLFADHVRSWWYEAGDHLLNFVIIGAIMAVW